MDCRIIIMKAFLLGEEETLEETTTTLAQISTQTAFHILVNCIAMPIEGCEAGHGGWAFWTKRSKITGSPKPR